MPLRPPATLRHWVRASCATPLMPATCAATASRSGQWPWNGR